MNNCRKIMIMVPTLQMGGQENVASKTAELLSDDYEVDMLIFDSSGQVFFPKCNIINIDIPAGNGIRNKILNVFRRCVLVKRIKMKNKYDYCLSFGKVDGANLVNMLTKGSEKVIVDLRAYDKKLFGWQAKIMYCISDGVVCCSRELRDRLLQGSRIDKDKLFAVNNPFDIAKMQELSNEDVDDYVFSQTTIVSHGRLNEVKNYPRLIKAFSLVRKEYPQAQLLLIGEGAYRDTLNAVASAMDVSHCVSMIGKRVNPFKYLSRSTLFALSSFSEGFPNSLVEGMCFLPAVAVDCPTGPSEIMYNDKHSQSTAEVADADYGILVRPSDRGQDILKVNDDDRLLASAMIELLKDPQKLEYFREKAHQRACMFSNDVYKSTLISILEGL